MDIAYNSNAANVSMSAEEWLSSPNPLGEDWRVYFRAFPAGEVLYEQDYRSDVPLRNVIEDVDDELHREGSDVDDAHYAEISPEFIESFYPDVPRNDPPALVFFDGAYWYWSESCDRVNLD